MRILAVFLSLLASTSALGDNAKLCETMGENAYLIMERRQSGMPMSTIMKAVTSSTDGAMQEFSKMMVIEAYEEPQYSVPENRTEAAKKFRNKIELICFKSN